MKLVLFDEYRLGVIQDGRVVDAMEAVEGITLRRPRDIMEEVMYMSMDGLEDSLKEASEGLDVVTKDIQKTTEAVRDGSTFVKKT